MQKILFLGLFALLVVVVQSENFVDPNPINYFTWSAPPKVGNKKRIIIASVKHIKGLSKCVSKFILEKKFKAFMTYGLKTPKPFFKLVLECKGKGCFDCLLKSGNKDVAVIVTQDLISQLFGPLSFTKGFNKFRKKIKKTMLKVKKKLTLIKKLVPANKDNINLEISSQGYKIWLDEMNHDILIRLSKTIKMKRYMLNYGEKIDKIGKDLRNVSPELLKQNMVKRVKVDVDGSKKFLKSSKFDLDGWCKTCNVGLLFNGKTMTPYFIYNSVKIPKDEDSIKPYPLLENKLGGKVHVGKSVKYILRNSKVLFVNGREIGFRFEQKKPIFIMVKPLLNFLFSSVNTKVKQLPLVLKLAKKELGKLLKKTIKNARKKCRKSLISFTVLFNVDDLWKSTVSGQITCQHPRVGFSHVALGFNNFRSKKCGLYPGFTGGYSFSTNIKGLVGHIRSYLSLIGCRSRKCFEDCFPLPRKNKLIINLPKFNLKLIKERLKKYKQSINPKLEALVTIIKGFALYKKL